MHDLHLDEFIFSSLSKCTRWTLLHKMYHVRLSSRLIRKRNANTLGTQRRPVSWDCVCAYFPYYSVRIFISGKTIEKWIVRERIIRWNLFEICSCHIYTIYAWIHRNDISAYWYIRFVVQGIYIPFRQCLWNWRFQFE